MSLSSTQPPPSVPPSENPVFSEVTIGKNRTPRGLATLFAQGAAMGAANTVPGVSGGTMALIFGIYEELITSFKHLASPTVWRALFKGEWRTAYQQANGTFLLVLGAGIISALLALAWMIERLLAQQPTLVWAFFFGLITASIWSVGRRVTRWNWLAIGLLLIGSVGAFSLVGLTPAQTPDSLWFLMFTGALAVCALILPGISGSLVLLLLGKYEYVVSAVNQRDLVPLLLIAVGGLIGLVLFAQVLSYLFKHHPNPTLALLTGFVIGSLRKVWPWQALEGNHSINILPSLDISVLYALALAIGGFMLVLLLDQGPAQEASPKPQHAVTSKSSKQPG